MREILFRGKRIDNGKWVEGAYMPHYYSTRYGKVAAIFTNDDVHCKTYRFPVDPAIEKKTEYNEIKELYKYCVKIGINAVLETLYDGYAIRLPNGGDFIQHQYSYGGDLGCVEPAIGCRKDYSAVSLKNAKAFVKRHKDRLNREKENACTSVK